MSLIFGLKSLNIGPLTVVLLVERYFVYTAAKISP